MLHFSFFLFVFYDDDELLNFFSTLLSDAAAVVVVVIAQTYSTIQKLISFHCGPFVYNRDTSAQMNVFISGNFYVRTFVARAVRDEVIKQFCNLAYVTIF